MIWHDSRMSYDLVVWEGERPVGDEEATKFYDDHIAPQLDEYDEHGPVPPTQRIEAYIEALFERWPIEDMDRPWSVDPEGSGSIVYLCLSWSTAEDTSAYAAEVALQHGLVCYDLQLERLRP